MTRLKGEERRILLHIGTPKTGSSAIQTFLSRQRDALLVATGLFYPTHRHDAYARQGHPTSGNGVDLAQSSKGTPEQVAAAVRSLVDKGPQSVIISSEIFWQLTAHQLAAVRDALAEFGRITIIFYARPQLEHIVSAYCQTVKNHAYALPISSFLSQRGHLFAYATRLEMLESLFGRGSVIARPYLGREMARRSVVVDFLSAIGVDPTALDTRDPGQVINPSIDLEHLSLYLAMPASAAIRTADLPPGARHISRSTPPAGILTPDEMTLVTTTFEEDNRRLVDMRDGDFPDFNLENAAALAEMTASAQRPDPESMILLLATYAAALEKRLGEMETKLAALDRKLSS